jgi:hypothetical protein
LGLSNVADVPVKATLDCDKSVTIEIFDLISVSSTLPLKDGKHKAYASNQTTRLTAVTTDVKKFGICWWRKAQPTNNLRDVPAASWRPHDHRCATLHD